MPFGLLCSSAVICIEIICICVGDTPCITFQDD